MIFDKIFGKKGEEKGTKTVFESAYDFDDIPEWIEKEKESLDLDAKEISKIGVDKINAAFEELESITMELEEKEIDQEVLKKLENITITSKKKFCESMKNVLAKRKRSIPEDYKQLIEFMEEAQATVNSVNKTHHTHGRYLGITFQSYLKEMGKELKIIVTFLNVMRQKMDHSNKSWREIESIEDMIDEYRLLHQSEAEINPESIESEKNKLSEELKMLETKKEEMLQDESYLRYESVLERLDEIEEEMHYINVEIYDATGPLKRILKKMHKAIENNRFSTSYHDMEFLNNFIDHPAVTVLADDGALSKTNALMRAMLEALEAGAIDEKRGKVEKSMSIAKGILSGKLDDMKKKHISLENEMKGLKDSKELYNLDELTRVERDIEQCNHRISVLNEELEHAMDISKDVQEKKDKAKMKIKKMIEGFYPEITINL